MNNYFDRNTLRKMSKHNSTPSPYYRKKLKRTVKLPVGSTYVVSSFYGYDNNGKSIILFIYTGHYERANEIYHTFKMVRGNRNHKSEEGLWTSMYNSIGGEDFNDHYEISDWALCQAIDENNFVRVGEKDAAKIILLGEVTDEYATFKY